MTETGRQQEHPGAEDAGRCQTQEAFREAPEFAKEDAKPSQAGTPDETLRVFKDGKRRASRGSVPGNDVIVRRLEGRCRFRIGTRGEQTAGQQGPDSALYSVPSRLRCVRAASSRFGNALSAWLRACKGTSAADPTSRDYGRWQPGARRCKLTLIDDGPRVEETARSLSRMPHEESRTVGRDLRKWLTSRHPWAAGDRIRDLMDHETGSLAPGGSSDFGEQLQKLNEKWSDDIEIDKSVGNNDEPTTEQPVVLRRSEELGETRVLAALLTPQTGYSYEQVLSALKKTEGESRRQLFLEVGDIRRYHADELNDALEMLSYEFRMLVSREQLALIRRTTHATVIEEALRPDDMPGGPGEWPTGPVDDKGRFRGADHWKKAKKALADDYGEIASEYGQHDAEYLLPGGTLSRITVNTNGLDIVRLIERLYEGETHEYSRLGRSLWECIDEQAYDGGLLALLFPA